jgi:hypothetical protein
MAWALQSEIRSSSATPAAYRPDGTSSGSVAKHLVHQDSSNLLRLVFESNRPSIINALDQPIRFRRDDGERSLPEDRFRLP